MSSREANIEKLNYAITTLNDDAEDMHGLIIRSVEGLENATTVSNKAADNASKIIEVLTPLAKQLAEQHRDSTAMLEETKRLADEQRATIAGEIEELKSIVGASLEAVRAETQSACVELKDSMEGTLEEFEAKSLKEQVKTRDNLQTDILGFTNATSSRLDGLESEVTKVDNTVKSLEDKVNSSITNLESAVTTSVETASKKIIVPIYAAIALGVINLICLIMLLMR